MKLLALQSDSPAEVARYFQGLHQLVESLALTSAEYCFAQNWLTSAQQLWEAGQHAAARYQVGIVAKKLALTDTVDGSCTPLPNRSRQSPKHEVPGTFPPRKSRLGEKPWRNPNLHVTWPSERSTAPT